MDPDADGVRGGPGVNGVSPERGILGEPGDEIVGVGVVEISVVLWNEVAPRDRVRLNPFGLDRFRLIVGGSDGGEDVLLVLSTGGGESAPSFTCSMESSNAGVIVAALNG